MEIVFRKALAMNSTYIRLDDWAFYMPEAYKRRPGVNGKALVLQNWPTKDMRALTAAARALLEAGDCNAVVLEVVMDDTAVQELLALGWTDYYSILSLTL
jgi:hypothetical protein